MNKKAFIQLIKECVNEVIHASKQEYVYPNNFSKFSNYIRLVKKASTDEYVVYWYQDGNVNDHLSYYTNDKEDALITFEKMKTEVDAHNRRI